MSDSRETKTTPRRVALLAAFAFLAALYVFSTWRDLARGPHIDEIEHLHTAVRMARGDRIYVDFAQHHPPLFHGLLMPLVPDGNSVEDLRGYVTRARLLVAVMLAMTVAAAASLVWRAARNPWTVVIFVALVLAAGGIWRNGLGDIRPDAAAMALWWIGAVLVLRTIGDRLSRPSAALCGIGIGLVFVAALVIPRWPLMSLVLGVVLLIRIGTDWRALLIASAAALATAAAGIGALALLSDLRLTYYFTIELSQAMFEPLGARAGPEFARCPPLLRPLHVLLAGAVIAAAWLHLRNAFAARSLVPVLVALTAASLCEIRFFYPYPFIDFRYFANWALIASALLALMPQAAAALLAAISESLRKVATAVMVTSTVLVLVAATDVVGPPPSRYPAPYWKSTAWILARMGPRDTAWLGWSRPIGIRDASYYPLLGDLARVAVHFKDTEKGRRFLPPIGDADLPPCRLERGLEPNLRFLNEPTEAFPESQACFERLLQRGTVVRTGFPNVYLVPRS